VQPVIDAGFALRFLGPGVERVAHVRAASLNREIDDRSGAADRGGARAGFEIVARSGAAERHVEMGVGVNAAGKQEHARSVERFVSCSGQNTGAYFLDGFAFDEDVGLPGLASGDHRPVLDEKPHQSQFLPVMGGVGAEAVRSSQDCGGRPKSICSIVMHPGTGQTR